MYGYQKIAFHSFSNLHAVLHYQLSELDVEVLKIDFNVLTLSYTFKPGQIEKKFLAQNVGAF